jgi:hypothetical protein
MDSAKKYQIFAALGIKPQELVIPVIKVMI